MSNGLKIVLIIIVIMAVLFGAYVAHKTVYNTNTDLTDLTVQVVDTQDNPIKHSRIFLLAPRQRDFPLVESKTDIKGFVNYKKIPLGTYYIIASDLLSCMVTIEVASHITMVTVIDHDTDTDRCTVQYN